MSTRKLLLLLFVIFSGMVQGQECTNFGQNPGTAFPVCGSSVFSQSEVAICGTRNIPTPCANNGALFQDKNPYWYKFTCFASGTLGFVITPNNLNDDYDWQLFDVTGRSPADVYTDETLFVACNWSGEPGVTGASAAGGSLTLCDGGGVPLFSAMPPLIVGHNYLLLVSHFTNSQSGYSLEFKGGTASITDTTPPKLAAVKALCDNKRLSLKLNKRMKCSSLALNGSDFIISSPTTKVISAESVSCTAAFDMDSIVVTLSNPLAPGDYTLQIRKGADNNTLLDNCDAAVPDGDNLSFSIQPAKPATIDSITPPACAPDVLNVIFSDPIICSSVAADGSDFALSGSSVRIVGASCAGGSATTIQLKLSSSIATAGDYSVSLKKGSDGNTVLNECSIESAEGGNIGFATKDTVSASFSYTIRSGCKADTGFFNHKGGNGITSWRWSFGINASTTEQNPEYTFPSFGPQSVTLLVSNGTCSDSAKVTFNLDSKLKANFTAPNTLCPTDVAIFKDTSSGSVLSWSWDFGNGKTSTQKDPEAQTYPATTSDKIYSVQLVVRDNNNCVDTAYKQVKVLNNCFIAVASAFTPNGDGLNDYLYPINAHKARNLAFKVFNRYGQLVFETQDFTKKWDGTFKGVKQATGTYVWMLSYTNIDTGQKFSMKGTSVLIR